MKQITNFVHLLITRKHQCNTKHKDYIEWDNCNVNSRCRIYLCTAVVFNNVQQQHVIHCYISFNTDNAKCQISGRQLHISWQYKQNIFKQKNSIGSQVTTWTGRVCELSFYIITIYSICVTFRTMWQINFTHDALT